MCTSFLLFSHFRAVSPSTRLSVSPIRPVKSPVMTRKQVTATAEVLPPWKQAGYSSEASYTRMLAGAKQVQMTSTQVQIEQRWEGSAAIQQQVGIVKEVNKFSRGCLASNTTACLKLEERFIYCKFVIFVNRNFEISFFLLDNTNDILQPNSTCM